MSRFTPAPFRPLGKRRPLLRLLLAALILGALLAVVVTLNRVGVGAWLFKRADRMSAPVLASPAAASPEDVDRAIERFRAVTRFAHGTMWATSALDRIGRLAFAQHRYAQAREAFEPVCAMYGADADMCMMSRVFIGRCYEAEGELEKAARTYVGMEQLYPWTPLWIESPIYPGELYERHGKGEQAAAAYRHAQTVFLRRLRGTLDPDSIDAIRWNLAMTHESLGEWNDAVQVFESALTADSRHDMRKRPDMWFHLGRIYEERLRQPWKAKNAYQQLITEFPIHPAAVQAAEALKRLSGRPDSGGP